MTDEFESQAQHLKVMSGGTLRLLVELSVGDDPLLWPDWNAQAQIRRNVNSPDILAEFEIQTDLEDLTAGQALFIVSGLTESGVWDVCLTDPDSGDKIYWPNEDDDRHTITVIKSSTREVPVDA